jgi:hypothetical protein
MGIEPQQKIIDGNGVYVLPLLGETAALVFYQIQKCIAPAIVQAMGAIKGAAAGTGEDKKLDIKKLLGSDIDISSLSDAIDSIHEKMTAAEWLSFLKTTLSRTTVNDRAVGDKVHFDEVFSGKILLLYKVLWFTLEVNFGDFFEAVGFGVTKENERPKTTGAEKE